MSIVEFQKLIDALDYVDARVDRVEANYFADEVFLEYENIWYLFSGCYDVHFDHVKSYDKMRPVREMNRAHVPYFLQKVNIEKKTEAGEDFLFCKIEAFPMDIKIMCKEMQILRIEKKGENMKETVLGLCVVGAQ